MNSICPVARYTDREERMKINVFGVPVVVKATTCMSWRLVCCIFLLIFFHLFWNLSLEVVFFRGVYERGAQRRALYGSQWWRGSGWEALRGWLGSPGVECWKTVVGHIELKGGRVSETSCCLLNWIYCALPPPHHHPSRLYVRVYLDRVCVSNVTHKGFCLEEIKEEEQPALLCLS